MKNRAREELGNPRKGKKDEKSCTGSAEQPDKKEEKTENRVLGTGIAINCFQINYLILWQQM